jgi:DNA repair exonuclease SbcCD nuclease subunit
MTALVTADWHLTEQRKDRYRFRAMEFIAEQVDKHEVDQLIILGDLTHNKNHHPDTLVNDIVDLLQGLSCLCEVYIPQGNHDYIEADTPFFHFVRWLKNVHWIQRPMTTQLKGLGRVCFLPHTRDHQKDWAGVKDVWDDCDLIFAHNAFEGARSENSSLLHGIPLDIFPRDVPIISGDIHKPQRLQQLTYVGSPYTQKYGDNYEPRVLLLHDLDESTRPGIESIPVPGPQKRLIELYEGRMDFAKYQNYKDDMVKVRVHLTNKEREEWPTIRDNIKKWFSDVVVEPILERTAPLPWEETATLKDDKELIREYGVQQKLSREAMDVGYGLSDEA